MGFSIRTRILLLAALSMLTVAVTAYAVLGRMQERDAEVAAFQSVREVARFFSGVERGATEKLSSTLDAIAADDELRGAFARRDRAALLRAALPLFETLRERSGVTHWYFIEPDHTCFLRVHAPDLHGDRIDRVTLALAERSGDLGAGKELGRTAFALRVVRPWRDRDGTLVGFVELAQRIDQFLAYLKEQTGDDFALVVKKKHLDEQAWRAMSPGRSGWDDRPDVVVVDTTTFSQGIVDFQGDVEGVPDRGTLVEGLREGDRAFVRGAFPIRDALGRKVGALFVLHDVTEVQGALEASRRRGLFVVLALGAGLLTLLAIAFERLVFARLSALLAALLDRGRRGKGSQPLPVAFHVADEIGKIEVLVSGHEPAPGAQDRASVGQGGAP